MKRTTVSALLALILVFALALSACGGEAAPETTAAAAPSTEVADLPALGLQEWTLSTSTWSSPNGATVHLTATPYGYVESRSVDFVVRLEGEDVANVPCQWDGTHYTASAELNAADGLCYYVLMQDKDGNSAEIPVNTPSTPTDESLINMETSLKAYCDVMVEESSYADGKLTITTGTATVQAPKITNEGETIICQEAKLILSFNGEDIATTALTLAESGEPGSYKQDLAGTAFDVPAMEDDQQLILRLDVTLSNGQILSASGNTWFYNAEGLLPVVG